MLAVEAVFWRFAARRITPNNFIAEVFLAKDGVHQHSEVSVGGMVAVEEHASRFFEQFVAKQQAGRHH